MAIGDLITKDGQLEWDGFLLGSETPYKWLELTGWEDTPGYDNGNVLRPARHGAWSGRLYGQERVITWSARIKTAPGAFGAAVTALRSATTVSDDDTELPLVVRTKDGETRVVFCKVTGRILPNQKDAGIGRGTVTIQWTCADPRIFSLEEESIAIPQPDSGDGYDYPLDYPIDYGTGSENGARTATVTGDMPATPIVTFTGPCEGPRLTNNTLGRTLEFGVALDAAETLTVDTNDGSVLLGSADRLYTLTAASVPVEDFTLTPGPNELVYRADLFGGGASCTVTWRNATM